MTDKLDVEFGGHRGMGCTDHIFYQSIRDIKNLPVENTAASARAAFAAGCAYVEMDAVPADDKIIFSMHNVESGDHFFDPVHMPMKKLNHLPFSKIKTYPSGRSMKGEVALFSEMMDVVSECDPHSLPWAVNVEIKGVQGSKQDYEDNAFIKNLADVVRKSKLPLDRVLFSSFSLQNIIAMSHELPQAQFGMLFAEKKEPAEAFKPIYANHGEDFRYQYLQFTEAAVEDVCQIWRAESHDDALLEYLHPEIMTVTDNMIDMAADKRMGINCWALFEKLDDNRIDYYKRVAQETRDKNVSFTIITDYLPEMRHHLTP